MLRVTKKNTAFLITVVMVALMTVLAACSNGDSGDDSNPANPDAAPSETPEQPAEEPKVRGNITVSLYDRGVVPPEEGTIEDNRWTDWLNENGPANVDFVAIPRWESVQKFNALFAAGDAPDLIFEYSTAFRNQLYAQKQLLPLDDYLQYMPNYQALMEQYPIVDAVGRKDDGKLYELGKVSTLRPNHTMLIRQDWLDNLGLEAPKTTEEFFKVATAFATQDPDRNGQNDTYGTALSFVSGMVVDFMFGSVFTVYDKAPWYDVNGELVFGWERMQAAAEFKKRLYEAGAVDPDYLTDGNGEKAKQDWISGKLGIYGANNGFTDFPTFEAMKQTIPDAKVIAIPLPQGPFGQFSPVVNNPVQMTAVVNANAENPQAVAEYVNFLLDPLTQTVLKENGGLEGVHYTLDENGCQVPIDPEKNKLETSYFNDFVMLTSSLPGSPCNIVFAALNPAEQTELRLEFAENVSKRAYEAYMNPERPMPALTHSEHMPALPEEMELRKSNAFKAIQDILAKTVISGDSYSVEQAMTDARQAWEQANGQEIDQWMADWYTANKDTALLTEDLYQFAEK